MKFSIAVIAGVIAINLSSSAFASTSDTMVLVHDAEQVELVSSRELTFDELDAIGGKSRTLKKVKKVARAAIKIGAKSNAALNVGIPVATVVGWNIGRAIAIHVDGNPDPGQHASVIKIVDGFEHTKQSAREIIDSVRRK